MNTTHAIVYTHTQDFEILIFNNAPHSKSTNTLPFDQCICHNEASYFTTLLRHLQAADQIFIMNHYIIQLDTFEGNLVVL